MKKGEKKGRIVEFKEDEEHPHFRKLKENARKISIYEGSAASFSSGFGVSQIVPFALAINAQPLHIGFLSSFSGLMSPLSQLIGSKMLTKFSRKKLVTTFVLLQSLMWLSITLLAYLFWKGFFQSYLPFVLIILYSLVLGLQGVTHPAWFGWMGDLIPAEERGKFWSKRNRITGAVGLTAFLIGAFVLDSFKTKGFLIIGFMIIFTLAFLFRFVSYLFFKKQFSPKFKIRKKDYFSFSNFIKSFDNYGKFALYQAMLFFALMIAGPFFSVYMLQELQFSYVTFTIVAMSGSIFFLLFNPLVGKFSDRFGNTKLLWIANILFVISPLFWIIFKNPVTLIFSAQILSGLANAALIIGLTNFTYDAVSPKHRPICIAYKGVMVGIGTFVGSILGGAIIKYLPLTFVKSFMVVVIASSILRFVVGISFLPFIKDERKIEKMPPMHINIAHPFKTINAEMGWFRSVFR